VPEDVVHITLQMRVCKTCEQEKLLVENFKPTITKGRLYFDYECRKCANVRSKKWYQDNIEYARAQDREQYWADPEKARAKVNAHNARNRPKRRAGGLLSRWKNIETTRARDREAAKRWRTTHPFEASAWAARQRAIKRGAKVGQIRKKDIDGLFEKQRGKCAACKNHLHKSGKNKYHIDHIQPLSKGGAHALFNFQLLCPRCNMSKKAEDPIEYMQKLGFLL
jgi:5-methylcytosine-specific restriction endonuclease McrA